MKNHFTLIIAFLISSSLFSQTVVLEREAALDPELYSIDGNAFLEELSDGSLQFRLSDDFDTPSGPDVRVILNSSISGSGGMEVINLSTINHFSGALTVNVPSSVDIEDYDFVVFFCVNFNQLWASGQFGSTTNVGGPICEESDVNNASGSDTVDICPTDGNDDVIDFENSLDLPAGSNYVYLITDIDEDLQEIVNADEYDFEGSSSETQRVYGLQYEGTLQPMIGSNRLSTTATDCHEHSADDSFITITKDGCIMCSESDVDNANGSNQVDICPTDGNDDYIDFENSLDLPAGSNYVYLITDINEDLQEVVDTDDYDFEGSSSETQRVYGLQYEGTLQPMLGSNRLSTTATDCHEHSADDNFITVTKNACITCDNSSVNNANGANLIDICPSDSSDDIIQFQNSLGLPAGNNYAYLITDQNQILQQVVSGNNFNFEGSSTQTQRVYGLNYEGTLNSVIGSNRLSTTGSDCHEHSDNNNFITITKNACITCDMSTVSNASGPNQLDICPSDNSSDIIQFQNSLGLPAGSNYVYLITDQNEILQQVITTNNFNFEGSSSQTQRVYGLQYEGTLNTAIGSNRLSTTATDCHEHSDNTNFITVTKNACITCNVSSVNNSNGSNQLDICPSDNTNDIVQFQNSLGLPAGNNYVYLITDQNQILQQVVNTSSYNFEGSSTQTQRVYGLQYEGTLNALIGSNRLSTSATDCHEHSDNTSFITVTKNACAICNVSTVTNANGSNQIDICPTDNTNDNIQFQNSLSIPAGSNYAYLITDQNQILQQVVSTNSFNFEGSSDQTQRVYGIQYEGTLNPAIGSNRLSTTATDCHEHSNNINFITVTKNACIPPFQCLNSQTFMSGAISEIDICPTDGLVDNVIIENSLGLVPGMNYAYIVTDANQVVQDVVMNGAINFEGSGLQTQRIYGIHYSGALSIVLGQNRQMTTAAECFIHSDSNVFLTVTKNACIPVFNCLSSSVTTNGMNNLDLCATDGVNDIITFNNTINVPAGTNYAYLITNSNNILVDISTTDNYNFEGATDPQLRVHGVHYDGTLLPQIGFDRSMTTASGCIQHTVSNGFVTISTTASCIPPFECLSSTVSSISGNTNYNICSNDGQGDVITFSNSLSLATNGNYAYIITDSNENLMAISELSASFDFEGTGVAEQRVYGIHYDGTLNVQVGQNRLMTTATGCFSHSNSNTFITITKDNCEEPFECMPTLTATTDWVTDISICPSDGIDDNIELRNSLFIPTDENYAYLITDTTGILQEVTRDTLYNFEGSSDMEQRVYGIHYDGTLIPLIGEDRLMTTATGCFTHSGANLFLSISKEDCMVDFECVESLTATVAWVTQVDICATDGEDDIILIQNNIDTEPGENYAFLITDEFEVLQEITLDSLYNFENTGTEEQRVYGISYSGTLDAKIGETRKNTTASDCYIHSGDNLFITINKTVLCEPSSTEDEALEQSIAVFPNPSNGNINIVYSDDNVKFESIKLLDINGKLIQNIGQKRNIEIHTPGVYLLHFANNENSIVKKIVIN